MIDNNLTNRMSFFDAVQSWSSEINKEIDITASSKEVLAAYHHINYCNNLFLKNNDGTWVKSMKQRDRGEFIRTILWLRRRVIM